ncbi:hypothetical protein ACHAWF_000622 [Thalassiosira exigua]
MKILSFLTTSAVLSTSFEQVKSHNTVSDNNQDDASIAHLRGITSGFTFHDHTQTMISQMSCRTYTHDCLATCPDDSHCNSVNTCCKDQGLACMIDPRTSWFNGVRCIHNKHDRDFCLKEGERCWVADRRYSGGPVIGCCAGYECDEHSIYGVCDKCTDGGNFGEVCRYDESCCGDAQCAQGICQICLDGGNLGEKCREDGSCCGEALK